MAKLRTLAPLVRIHETRTTRLPPKQKDPIYDTPEFRAWRAHIIGRAGGQCQAIEDGYRYSRAQPHHRMYADHITELRDGGSLLDPMNGQCLCRSHHEIKTVAARVRRLSRPVDGG
jgi:5-methylcytosine-specific restriction enzyme A